MLKNSALNQMCMYTAFQHHEVYTVLELLSFISLGIQCFYGFDESYLREEGIKRLGREWCKILKAEEADWLVSYGLSSRCVESIMCFTMTIGLLKDIIAGSPRTPICDLVGD
jgi:hypothetical protein